MSGEFPTLSRFSFSTTGLRLVGLISFFLAIATGLESGIIIVDSNVVAQFYIVFAVITILTFLAIIVPSPKARLSLSSSVIVFYIFLAILSLPYLVITAPLIIALFVELRQFNLEFGLRSRSGLWLLSFSIAVTAMILISGLLRGYPTTQSIGILVASISDDVHPGGTPLLFAGGIVYFTYFFVFSISVQALLMFAALSFLLVENYFLIVGFIRGNTKSVIGGQVSGALTVLSCQCESITAAFPSIVSLVLSAAILPLILESIVLVFLTNHFLRNRYLKGKRLNALDAVYPLKNPNILYAVAALTLISLPVIETIGVYFRLQGDLYFFGSLNFTMFIAGVFTGILLLRFMHQPIVMKGALLPSIILSISSFIMLVWFYPPLTGVTISSGSYFAFMSISSFVGGTASGVVYAAIGPEGRKLFLEFLAMMFTMFAIVVFYVSILTGYTIWPSFSLTDQVIFSISVWVIALPFMWIATNIALNSSVPQTRGEIDATQA